MWIPKIYLSVAAIALLSLATVPRVWSQESGGEVESFNRSLGLEEMGSDLASVEHELEHGSPANTPETPNEPSGKKAPREKRAQVQRNQSFSDLAFHSNPSVTSTVRAYYMSHTNAATMVNYPSYDSLIQRFDSRFSNYGYSRNNIGDTFAGFLIVAWETVHDTNVSNTPEGIRRARVAVGQILEKRGKAAALTPEKKQKVSELLKCLAELGAEEARRARQSNNQAELEKTKTQLTKSLGNIGINLYQWRFTDRGFVKI
jgi:hypothetical protein